MQFTIGRFGALIAAGGALALAAAGAPAGAQGAAPVPCEGSGVQADAKGDAQYTKAYAASVGPVITPAPASYDVRQVFLTYGAGADGKKHLKAHLVIEDLNGEQIDEPWAAQIRYSVEINAGGTFVRPTAISEDGELSYSYYTNRVAPPAGNPRYLEEVDTTGSAVTGPMGTITIDVPADVLPNLKPGDKVEANGYSWAHTGTDAGGSLVDYAPDDRSFKSFTVTECSGAPAPQPTVEAPKVEQPAPGTQPQPAPQQQGSTPPPATQKRPAAKKSCAAKAKARYKGKKNAKKLKAALKKCKKAKRR